MLVGHFNVMTSHGGSMAVFRWSKTSWGSHFAVWHIAGCLSVEVKSQVK